jgi:peptide-methionine (S)-S-oxide reductase
MSLRVSPDLVPLPASDPPEASASGELVLAGGCFWCTEAVYRGLAGVREVVPGYAGGSAATANYRAVCGGDTGHAEAIRIRFDPARASMGALLQLFFAIAHDPTQRDRQGHDVGTQYRSAVFFASEAQRALAAAYIAQLDAAGVFAAPIATTLEPLERFFVAEAEHHDYAARHPWQPYVAAVAAPKVEKRARYFADRVEGGA